MAFLAPTLSYLAYANEHLFTRGEYAARFGATADEVWQGLQPEDRYTTQQRLLSLYESHSDGSGVCYSSRLRPILTMRPHYTYPFVRGPHQFGADLHLIAWLQAKGYECDIVTDEDLHAEGARLLQPYRVILTGSHPEYWTGAMLDGLQTYLAGGGRLMYLGGNGLYWVTAIGSDSPHVIEVRRGQNGTRPWQSAPGENYLSTSGELAGLWRDRGRAPQKLVGVGYIAEGYDISLPYRRMPGSFDPRAAFIFDGIAPDELIGDFGLVMHGAAGFEIDRLDFALGTPPHALVLASAVDYTGVSSGYRTAIEGVRSSNALSGGTDIPEVSCDLVYFEGPHGGAVFSTGSIAWCGSLAHNGYDNNVSRITENVLKRFASDDPIRPV
jgi:N,N-dimethylformamidase